MNKPKLVAIVGPTATGKSAMALRLAEKFGGEIVSADSVQVYRGLDIGSAKPTADQRRRIPHHLIDILDPDQEYSASTFREQADEVIQRLHRGNIPVFIAGGSGLYLKVLYRGIFRGPAGEANLRAALRRRAQEEGDEGLHRALLDLDPDAAARIHPHDTFRLVRALEVFYLAKKPISQYQKEHGFRENPYHVLKIGLQGGRDELYRRIEARTAEMMEKGWLEEVRSLLDRGYSADSKSMQSLGYKRIVSHLKGEMALEETLRLIKQDTRRFAKRQITWFKADPEVRWFPAWQEGGEGLWDETVTEFLQHC